MSNITTPAEVINNTTDYITPNLPETPLYQEVSSELGPFFYVTMTFIGVWLLLYLCSCAYKSHKYHGNDGLPTPERLRMV